MAVPEEGIAFVSYLQSAGVPEQLWEAVVQKLAAGDVGTGGDLKVLPRLSGPCL
jgi:hypothetical protein